MDRPDVHCGWAPRFVIALVLVAVAAAGFAIAFRATLAAVTRYGSGAANAVEAMTRLHWWWRLLLPAIGGLLAGTVSLLVERWRGRGDSHGNVMEAAVLGGTKLALPVSAMKSLASWTAIVFGGSLGREGPLIQFGAAAGDECATRIRLGSSERRILIAAGTAAGFAAAYNTPLAAVAFVVEIVAGFAVSERTSQRAAAEVSDLIVPTLVSTVIATALTRMVVGAGPIYGQHSFTVNSVGELAAFAAVGLIAGIVAVAFNALVAVTETAFRRRWLGAPWRSALGGLAAGAIIVAIPAVAGNGYEPLNDILGGNAPLTTVALLLVAKCVATATTVGSGSPGGVFTPILLIGGCTGFLVGAGLSTLGLDVGPAGGYALVGMAAAIAAATHAPLMAAVLAFELSGDYAVVLPLVLATAFAAGLARALRRDSIYSAEFRPRAGQGS